MRLLAYNSSLCLVYDFQSNIKMALGTQITNAVDKNLCSWMFDELGFLRYTTTINILSTRAHKDYHYPK